MRPGTTRRRSSAHPRVAVLLGLAMVVAACGHRTSSDELVAANSQVLEGGEAAGGVLDDDDDLGPVDGGPAPDAGDPGAGGDPGSGSATGDTGGSSPGAATDDAGDGAVGADETDGGAVIGTPGETGPIVLGSVGNYSGIAGPPQAPMARAVQVWADWVNSRGGLFGRQVQVIVVDDRGDPAQHVAALRDLVENRGVVAFVANAGALTVASGRSYLERAGVPVIGTACANTTEFESPIFFPQCAEVSDFFYSVIRSGVQFGGTAPKLAFIACSEAQTCTDGYRKTITEGRARQAGAEVVYTARASLAQPDFTSECRNARQAGAELVHVLLDPTGVIRFGQSCARQGYNPVYVQGSATVFHETKDQRGMQNLIVSGQVFNFVGTETPARQEFQDVMASYYGEPPGPAEAYGWAAAKVFELAATRAAERSQSITGETLIDALHTFDAETLGGLTVPLTFRPGEGTETPPCAFAARVQDGEWLPLNDGEMICR